MYKYCNNAIPSPGASSSCLKQMRQTQIMSQHGTFELRIRSEFYCSNDVIVGHISLPHYRETVKSKYILCLVRFFGVSVLKK